MRRLVDQVKRRFEAARVRLSSHHLSQEEVILLLRGRAQTVGAGNLALLMACALLSVFTYKRQFVLNTLIWPLVGILIVALAGSFTGNVGWLRTTLTNMHLVPREGATEARTHLHLWVGIWFFVLLAIVVLDFFSIAHLITATGGWLLSPFSQFPAIMLVVGGVMALNIVTRVALFGAGAGFFWALAQTSLFGAVHIPRVEGPLHLSIDLIVVTLVNLAISLTVINRQQETGIAQRTGATQHEQIKDPSADSETPGPSRSEEPDV